VKINYKEKDPEEFIYWCFPKSQCE